VAWAHLVAGPGGEGGPGARPPRRAAWSGGFWVGGGGGLLGCMEQHPQSGFWVADQWDEEEVNGLRNGCQKIQVFLAVRWDVQSLG